MALMEDFKNRIAPLLVATSSLFFIGPAPEKNDAHLHNREHAPQFLRDSVIHNRDVADVRALAENLAVYSAYATYARKDTTAIAQFFDADSLVSDAQRARTLKAFWDWTSVDGKKGGNGHLINIDSVLEDAYARNAHTIRIDAPVPRSLNDDYFFDFENGRFLLVDVAGLESLRTDMRAQHEALGIPGSMRLFLSWWNYSNGLAVLDSDAPMRSSVYIGVDNLARPRDELDFIAGHEVGHVYQFLHPKGIIRAPGESMERRRMREHVADSISVAWSLNKLDAIMAGARFVADPIMPCDTSLARNMGILLAMLQNKHDYGIANTSRTHPTAVERYRFMRQSIYMTDADMNAHFHRARNDAIMRYRPD